MSLNPSPTKSNQMRTSVDRNIRINLNSKYIPSDFFPASISQINSCSRKSSFQSPLGRPRIASMVAGQVTQKCFNREQWRHLQSLRKKLVQIQRNSDQQRECVVSKDKQRMIVQRKNNVLNSSKKRKQSNITDQYNRKSSKLNLKNKVCRITKSRCKIEQTKEQSGIKNLSKNYNEYLQKIKKVINIDLDVKLIDSQLKQLNQNGSTQIINPQKYQATSLKKHQSLKQRQHKQSLDDLDTTNQSPKVALKIRPKSQLDSRQKLVKRNKILIFPHQRVRKVSIQRNNYKDKLKVKVRQIEKNNNSQEGKKNKQKSIKNNDRYMQAKKFSDINLGQDGMLTFHGQFSSPQKLDKQKVSKRIVSKRKVNQNSNSEGRKSLSDIPNYNYKNYIGRNSLPKIQKSLK